MQRERQCGLHRRLISLRCRIVEDSLVFAESFKTFRQPVKREQKQALKERAAGMNLDAGLLKVPHSHARLKETLVINIQRKLHNLDTKFLDDPLQRFGVVNGYPNSP